MKYPNKDYIEHLRRKYPPGTRLQLLSLIHISAYVGNNAVIADHAVVQDNAIVCGGYISGNSCICGSAILNLSLIHI